MSIFQDMPFHMAASILQKDLINANKAFKVILAHVEEAKPVAIESVTGDRFRNMRHDLNLLIMEINSLSSNMRELERLLK